MPTVVLKLFAVQGTGWTDGRTKRPLYASLFGEHTNELQYNVKLVSMLRTLIVSACVSYWWVVLLWRSFNFIKRRNTITLFITVAVFQTKKRSLAPHYSLYNN